jgi:hypothetical protein
MATFKEIEPSKGFEPLEGWRCLCGFTFMETPLTPTGRKTDFSSDWKEGGNMDY